MATINTINTIFNQNQDVLTPAFREILRHRLDSGRFELPFIPNRIDSGIITHLNTTLSEDNIKELMECILTQKKNPTLLLVILKNLPPSSIQQILDTTSEANLDIFNEFINILLYCSFGVENLNVTWSVVQTLLLNITSNTELNLIDQEEVNAELESARSDTENSINNRSSIFMTNMNQIWTSINWGSILRRSAQIVGMVGVFSVWGAPLFTNLLVPLTFRVGDQMTRAAIQSNSNTVASNTSEDVTLDFVVLAFSNAFSILKTYVFGK